MASCSVYRYYMMFICIIPCSLFMLSRYLSVCYVHYSCYPVHLVIWWLHSICCLFQTSFCFVNSLVCWLDLSCGLVTSSFLASYVILFGEFVIREFSLGIMFCLPILHDVYLYNILFSINVIKIPQCCVGFI